MRRKSFARVRFVSHFFGHFFVVAPPFLLCRSSPAHPPTSLADGWLQVGGCRRVAFGRRVAQTGGFWHTGGMQADGPYSHAAPAVVCRTLWRAEAAVHVVGLAAATVGSGAVGSSGWRSCLVYCCSVKLTATNPAEFLCELS